MSHGRRPVEIKIEDDTNDEDEMEIDEGAEVKPGPTAEEEEEYKEAVDEGQQAADSADTHGFDAVEVDYGDEDVDMRPTNRERPKERKKSS